MKVYMDWEAEERRQDRGQQMGQRGELRSLESL